MNAPEISVCQSLPFALRKGPKSLKDILLIEDSEDAKILVEAALSRFGEGQYCLTWAATLEEGLQRAAEQKFDIFLLDLNLPDSSGEISYAFIRKQANGAPIVVLTANDDDDTRNAIIASGASNYLLKQSMSGPRLILALKAACAVGNLRAIDHIAKEDWKPRQVLLIEDDEDAMVLVRHALDKYGENTFCLQWETSLGGALDRISRKDIDIVLLDLGLSDSSGTTAYLELRKAAPATPIIVLTGSDDMEVEFALLSCGADDFLDKTSTSGSKLIRSLEGALREARLRRQKRAVSDRPLASNSFVGF